METPRISLEALLSARSYENAKNIYRKAKFAVSTSGQPQRCFLLPHHLSQRIGANRSAASLCNLHGDPVSAAAKQALIATTKINPAVKGFFFFFKAAGSIQHVIYGAFTGCKHL